MSGQTLLNIRIVYIELSTIDKQSECSFHRENISAVISNLWKIFTLNTVASHSLFFQNTKRKIQYEQSIGDAIGQEYRFADVS